MRTVSDGGVEVDVTSRRASAGLDPDAAPRLSAGQHRIWFAHGVTPALMNLCRSYRLSGEVDIERLRAAVTAVVARHETLRTTFRAGPDGEPVAVLHEDLPVRWVEHDVSDLAGTSQELRLGVLAQREFATPIDLTVDSPLRVTVIRTGAAEHVMLIVAHLIAWDDDSWSVFLADLTTAYVHGVIAEPLPVRPPHDGADQADLEYWRDEMANPPEPLELPGVNGSVAASDWKAARCTARLSASVMGRVEQLAQESGTTPYVVLLAAYSALLHRYTHAEDFLVAAPVPTREAHAQGSIGHFGHTVALRMRPHSGESFRDLLANAHRTTLNGFAHQRVSLDRVVARVGFAMGADSAARFCPPGIHCERTSLEGRVAYVPLGLRIETGLDGAEVVAEYLVDVLDERLTTQMLRHFANLLDSALADPNRPLASLDLMDGREAQWLREVSSGELFEAEPTTLGELVAARAAAQPDATALVYEGRHYSYRETNELANQLAHWIIGQGIGTEDHVAVLLDKSPDLIITALAIAKAGAVYVPVDPNYPADRIAHILSDAQPKLVIREPVTGVEQFDPREPVDADRVRPLTADNAAYLIYTSGSTGLPKGVTVTHRPLTEYFNWFRAEYRVSGSDRVLQVASPSFDVSVGEIFGILSCGGRLVIPRPGALGDVAYLTELLNSEGVTSMHMVPSLLGLVLSLPGVTQWKSLRRVPVGGESLPGPVADKFHATFDASLHNFYGPTETVINASRYKVRGIQGTRTVPIGTPKINTQIHILDQTLRPVPVGVIGEIYIGGTHVARGYHRAAGLTAQRFIADPFVPGQRMYRSGDLARRSANGDIEFVGRADEQVKIRGFRIELGEIASAIEVDPSVGQALVVVDELPHVGKRLVAYLTPVGGHVVDLDRIRARISAALPDFMIPAAYVVLDEMPITRHGKINRDALPAPEVGSVTRRREPETATQRQVAALYARLLGVATVGADDSFVDLGGHSLLASKLSAAILTECGVGVDIREILERGTVAGLAKLVDQRRSGLVADDEDREGEPIPLLPSGRRLYEHGNPRRLAETHVFWLPEGITRSTLEELLNAVVGEHEVLRSRLDRERLELVPRTRQSLRLVEILTEDPSDAAGAEIGRAVDRLDPEQGWMLSAVWLHPEGEPGVLILVVHQLAADPTSWRVIMQELESRWQSLVAGAVPPNSQTGGGYRRWANALVAEARDVGSLPFWIAQLDGEDPPIGSRRIEPELDREADVAVTVESAPADVSAVLLNSGIPMEQLLVAAAARTVAQWRRRRGQAAVETLLAVQVSGRGDATAETVGLLGTAYPLRVGGTDPLGIGPRGLVERVARQHSAMPGRTIDYGLLRYLRADTSAVLRQYRDPQILLNYLGHDRGFEGDLLRRDGLLSVSGSPVPEPESAVRHELSIAVLIMGTTEGPSIGTLWQAVPEVLERSEITELQSIWHEQLGILAKELW
ncbi:non-ribosomal peptide synthetase [Mycobacteroides chelonae]|uniref:non-ribosomal peptide synthetase n=1 Tax=Mycobacteroides chelonae TaxID=1774 RepID=UPI0008A8718B|nr:non-ribosomal peptide synthetase [Mycobacteroides chelonae]OHU23038.1 non-ribosomal peptide synthetase [Mycobacteroides chelonae]